MAVRQSGQRALLRFLQRQGCISAADALRLEEIAQHDNVSIHELLERETIISERDLAQLLANTLQLPLIDLTAFRPDPTIVRAVRENLATKYELMPIRVDDNRIEVATANPLDMEALRAVEFATGRRVQAVVATRIEVRDVLDQAYRLQESLTEFLQDMSDEESMTLAELHDDGADLRTIARDADLPPVVKLADMLLIEGTKYGASDVHIEPSVDGIAIRYRIDGMLEEAFRFPKWVQNPLIGRFKVMAKLDITERRIAQDGRFQVRYQGRIVDFRVSTLPTQNGEKIALRILDASRGIQPLDELGFSSQDLEHIRLAARRPDGMILVTGPTGSGKTTTLYALLREIYTPSRNIVTIENPVEYQLKGINQVGINEKQGLTFAGVLRSVLRQDPDIILVGEIRDRETAEIAIQAAQTGHLVLSTIHTNDAAATLTRLIDLGIEPYVAASSLNLVVAQRLVRRVCPGCSAPVRPSAENASLLRLGDEGGDFRRGAGCPQCRQSGYSGRTTVSEVMPISRSIAKLIEARASETAIRQQARQEGLTTLLEDATDKLSAGITTAEEVLRVVQLTENGPRCPRCRKDVADDFAVCPHCSHALRLKCGSCAKPMNPTWLACPYCGTKATRGPALASLPAGEHRDGRSAA